jgi:retinol dehydrogenase-12
MKEKTCVITGANSGLGYWTTMALAEKGARIFMLCRSAEKGEKARLEIISKTGNEKISLILVELSSLSSIHKAVQTINELTNRVDVLINNAALVASERKLTEDGIEMQFAVNHIAPFYLTHLLLPLLMNAPEGRIVNISSTTHRRGKIYFEDVSLSDKYHILRAYGQSKLANVFFSYELNRKLIAQNMNNLSVYCVDPGHNDTQIGLKKTKGLHALVWWIRSKMGSSPEKGATCQIYVSAEDQVKNMSGKYWINSKPVSSSKYSHNEQDAQKLWLLSLELCGIKDFFKVK